MNVSGYCRILVHCNKKGFEKGFQGFSVCRRIILTWENPRMHDFEKPFAHAMCDIAKEIKQVISCTDLMG